MTTDRSTGFLTLNPRRRPGNWLLEPALQLRLPAHMLIVTLGFLVVFGGYGYATYDRLFALALEDSPNPAYFTRVFEAQTGDFLFVSSMIAIAYALVVLGLAVVHAHRMIGPMVPFRRQLEAMKNGDFGGRIYLRRGDAFQDLAEDLNELAQMMGDAEKSANRSDVADS